MRHRSRLDRMERVAMAGDGVSQEERLASAARDAAAALGVSVDALLAVPMSEIDAFYERMVYAWAREIVAGDVWRDDASGVLLSAESVDVWAGKVGIDLADFEDPRAIERGLWPGMRRGALWCALDRRADELRERERERRRRKALGRK